MIEPPGSAKVTDGECVCERERQIGEENKCVLTGRRQIKGLIIRMGDIGTLAFGSALCRTNVNTRI